MGRVSLLIEDLEADGVPIRTYAPEGTPRGALVWAHGGGFRGGDLDMPEAHWVASSVADGGYAVVSVDYRLAPTAHHPALSDDVLTAWRWARARGEALTGPGGLHLGGASAGGNLAAGSALRLRDAGERLPDSLVLMYPTLHARVPEAPAELAELLQNLEPARRAGEDYVREMYENYLGHPLADGVPADAAPGDADLTGLPPTLVVGSETDGLRASAEDFVTALERFGVPYRYAVEPGTPHGHLNRPEEPGADATIRRVLAWLDEQGA